MKTLHTLFLASLYCLATAFVCKPGRSRLPRSGCPMCLPSLPHPKNGPLICRATIETISISPMSLSSTARKSPSRLLSTLSASCLIPTGRTLPWRPCCIVPLSGRKCCAISFCWATNTFMNPTRPCTTKNCTS